MGLKRKASFTTITSPMSHCSSTYHHHHHHNQTSPIPMPFLGTATITVDEPPRHLHSRTRKRFRNDRPDEQSIYDKTLQWLFSAQRKPSVSQNAAAAAAAAADVPNEQQPSSSPSPPPLDPNQQTLQRFFQPVRASRSAQNQDYNHVQHLSNGGVSISNPRQPVEGMGMNNTGIDVDMDMDTGCAGMEGFVPLHVSGPVHAHAHQQLQQQLHEQDTRWVGGIGWM
ncbi:hypothetical protein GX51_02404 [Blastomyces parvus]|uniref:Uncharacterized protein n=1 Tax=Blastomyces parvus TaxID=2060905 RepID=A0A2B7XCD3_9EURO|nr:hypothetical protein GX51_02404 [Blastomyces parvus]